MTCRYCRNGGTIHLRKSIPICNACTRTFRRNNRRERLGKRPYTPPPASGKAIVQQSYRQSDRA